MLQRVYRIGGSKGTGGSLVITIPDNFVVVNKVEDGDYLKISEDSIEVVKNKKK